MRHGPLVLHHLRQVAHVDQAAAGRAPDEVLGLVGRLAADALADDLAWSLVPRPLQQDFGETSGNHQDGARDPMLLGAPLP
jgi:hypothetical protein